LSCTIAGEDEFIANAEEEAVAVAKVLMDDDDEDKFAVERDAAICL